jgi:uncharacterized RDD family membrane protein YckC
MLSDSRARENLVPRADRSMSGAKGDPDSAWRGELSQKLEAYRVRRRKLVTRNTSQSELQFEASTVEPPPVRAPRVEAPPVRGNVALAEPPVVIEEDFSFTIAIGRPAKKRSEENARMFIDVSLPPQADAAAASQPKHEEASAQSGAYPVATIEERRLAGLIDAACLLFAYGAFLTLFGSLGGHFTLSKLSAAVYTTTFIFVYLQYFSLFTIFGGTTPGMILRDLHVVSFSGEPPSPRQMLWRSVGYILSAGTFFLGFLWAMWDEDSLTWHDRLSHTYLSPAQSMADIEATHATSSH